MTPKRLLALLAPTLLAFESAYASDIIVESETEASGAGAIVFDTSKVDLDGDGEAVSLFDYDFGDNNVEFIAEGYWKSLVTASSAFTFGFGTTAAGSSPTLAFTQDVDLSLWFMLNKHFYFEAAFADSFEKNTVAAGYVGDGAVKSVRIANRGIEFPSVYSVSEVSRGIGGGDNQAPGISVNMSGERWRADGAFRYDMLEAEEKTWYGKDSVSTEEIALSKWNSKNEFALPSSAITAAVSEIYVENSNGKYTDTSGRKFNKLDTTQYLLVSSKNMVVISKDAKIGDGTAVAFKFTNEGMAELSSTLDSFIEETDEWFSGIDISKYTFFGSDTAKAFGEIDGDEVLYVKHPAGFSPFACAHKYDCGISGATDAAVASRNTETVSSLYGVEILEDDTSTAANDFFYDSHLYALVYRTDLEGDTDDMARAETRFPLAKEHPESYISTTEKGDLVLRIRTYTPVSRYDIGTDAVPGTVRVYKNGVLDPNAEYDQESGSIELSSSAGSGDRIYATWYKDSEDSETGALAGALGFEYRFSEKLKSDVAFSARWTIPKEYADATYSSPGFLTLATGTEYESGPLKISNVASVSFDDNNTTGKYRILGMDGTESGTSYLAKNAAVDLPDGFAPTLNTESGSTELEAEYDGSLDAESGVADMEISGYAVPVSWDFSQNEESNLFWAAKAIKLSLSASDLASSSKFEIALKGIGDYTDEKIYLQLGIEASDEFESIEESGIVPTWLLSESQNVEIEDTGGDWKIATILLTDEERSRISSLGKSNARIIVTSSGDGSGTIYIGPYEAKEISFQTTSDSAATVSSFQTTDASLRASTVDDFNTSTNTVQEIDWKFSGDEESVEMEAARYFEQTDMSAYSELGFYFKAEFGGATGAENFTCLEESDSAFIEFTIGDSDGNEAVSFSLPHGFAEELSGKWHSVSVDLDGGTVEIDGTTVSSGVCNPKIDKDVLPTMFKIKINPSYEDGDGKKIYKTGSMFLDELHLSSSHRSISFQDKTNASFDKKGDVLKIGEATLVKDFYAKAAADFNTAVRTGDRARESAAEVYGGTGATIAGIVLETEISKTSGKSGIKSASHKVKSESPLLSLLSFSEEYNFDSDGETVSKTDWAKIGRNAFSVSAKATSESDSWAVKQSAEADIESSFNGTKISAQAKANQKIPTTTDESAKIRTDDYFSSWADSTKTQLDTGMENATKRETGAEIKAEHQFKKAKLKPGVALSAKGTYTSSSSTTFSDSSKFTFAIPFAVKKNLFSFNWEKKAGETESADEGGDYKKDAGELAANLGEKDWFLKSIPVRDLFDTRISERVYEKIGGDTQTVFYSTLYSLEWKRQFKAAKYDFFIPNSAQASFERDIKASTSESDLYQAKIKTNSTAFNVFGKSGSMALFDWYDQDEYTTSLSLAAKIPKAKPENASMILNAYTQATFYMGDSDFLKTGLEISTEGKNDWSGKSTIIWKRRGSSRIMNGIIGIIRPSFDTGKITHTRTDSLNISASSSSSSSSASNTRKYGASYSHTLDSQITKYVTINTSLAADYSATWNKIATVTATLGLGCTVKF